LAHPPSDLGPGQLHDHVGDATGGAEGVHRVGEPGRSPTGDRGRGIAVQFGEHGRFSFEDGQASWASSRSQRSPSRTTVTTMRLESTRPSGTVTLLISWSRNTRTTARSPSTLSTAAWVTVPVEVPSPLASSSRRPSETSR